MSRSILIMRRRQGLAGEAAADVGRPPASLEEMVPARQPEEEARREELEMPRTDGRFPVIGRLSGWAGSR